MIDSIVVHYDEIAIKGKNRGFFERLLVENIKTKSGDNISSFKKEYGQITFKIKENEEKFDIERLIDEAVKKARLIGA
jgi:adenylyl- and sulfurtransferase ThiI